MLVFLPGAREIHGVESRLQTRVGDVAIHPLFGAMPFKAQRAAVFCGARAQGGAGDLDCGNQSDH